MSVPKKYEHIDFAPPKDAAEAAEKGLELRRRFGRGGTDIGVARARQFKNRETMSPDTIARTVSYFARHEVDSDANGWEHEDDPSAGWIAWLLWGGDPGRDWAERIKGQMEEADEKAA